MALNVAHTVLIQNFIAAFYKVPFILLLQFIAGPFLGIISQTFYCCTRKVGKVCYYNLFKLVLHSLIFVVLVYAKDEFKFS